MSTLGNNYVCGSAVWLNELLMHWFYSRQILRYYRFEASAALMDIARNTTKYAYIGIGVYKYFYIKQAAESKAFKKKNSLNYYYRFAFDARIFVTPALMLREVIHRTKYVFAFLQVF